MSLVTDLRSKLLAVSGVSTKVGTRIYWKARAQNSILPAIVLHTISGRLDQHMDGPMGTQGYRLQVDCMASTKLAVEALRTAVVAALVTPGTTGGTTFQGAFVNLFRDDFETLPEGAVHTEMVDVTVWFN